MISDRELNVFVFFMGILWGFCAGPFFTWLLISR